MKSLFIFLALVGLTISGCKKYDEDDKSYFRTPKQRLRGSWVMQHYFVNGVEQSNGLITFNFNVQKAKSPDIVGLSIHPFEGYGDDYTGFMSEENELSSEIVIYDGDGEISKNKEEIIMNPRDDIKIPFKILSLTKDKLVLTVQSTGNQAKPGALERFEFEKYND